MEYILYVYKEAPKKSLDIDSSFEFWKRKVINAHKIPEVGERIICEGAMNSIYLSF